MAASSGSGSGFISVKDLRFVTRIIAKNWYFVVVAVLVSSVAAMLYTMRLPDVYGASTQILLKDRETYNYQSQVYQNIGYVTAYGDIINQKRVLTSFDMINRTLDKLDFDVSYYNIGRLRTQQLYTKQDVPFRVSMDVLDARFFEEPFDLRFIDHQRFSLTYAGKEGSITRELPFNTDIAEGDFLIRVDLLTEVSPSNVHRFVDTQYRFVRHRRDRLVARYANRLQVENIDYTSILQIGVEDEVGLRAKKFLDTLSQEYIQYTLRNEIDINENTVSYIDRQLKEISTILDQYEGELQAFKESKGILDLSRENQQYFNQLVGYEGRKREFELMLKSVDSLEEYVLDLGDERMLPPSLYLLDKDAFLMSMLNDLYDQYLTSNRKLFDATSTNPAIKKADSLMVNNKSALLLYLKNTRKALTDKISDLDGQMGDYHKLIRAVPANQRDILNIERQVKVNERLYEFLLEKRANTVIARAGIIPQTKVIELARVLGVVRPDKTRILYAFILGGLMLSGLVVFVRVVFYDRVENAEQLREQTGMAVFGEIIANTKPDQGYVVVDSDPRSPVTESFRTVRTNLEYLPESENGKVVLITSYRPNEGKTFCSVNLAAILAKAGKKVLLLELDLHKPKVGTGLGVTGAAGLTNILIGKAQLEDCITPTGITDLDVVLSGPTPPNASELVLSKYMDTILDYGRMHYDYVVVDTPPVGLITDALVLMKHADATLFVINTRFANKDHVNNALEVYRNSSNRNFGLILNGVRMKKSKYYYNSNYGYGYSYGYGYGGGSSEPEAPASDKK